MKKLLAVTLSLLLAVGCAGMDTSEEGVGPRAQLAASSSTLQSLGETADQAYVDGLISPEDFLDIHQQIKTARSAIKAAKGEDLSTVQTRLKVVREALKIIRDRLPEEGSS